MYINYFNMFNRISEALILSFSKTYLLDKKLNNCSYLTGMLYFIMSMRNFEYTDKLLDTIWEKFGALASPVRLKILLALKEKPMCVCELSEHLSERQPLISQHLAILKNSGLVEAKRMGNRIQYSISDKKIIDIIELMEEFTIQRLRELVELKEG